MTNIETNQKRKRGAQPGNQNAKKKPDPEKEAEKIYFKQMNEFLDTFEMRIREANDAYRQFLSCVRKE